MLFDSIDIYAQTSQRIRRLEGPPSNELTGDPITEARYGLLCYSFQTGGLVDTCRVEFHLEGIGGPGITEQCLPDANGQITRLDCANGGHTHGPPDFPNDPRPLTFNDEPVLYPGDELTDPVTEKFDVKAFSPLNTNTAFTWNLPQASGIYSFNAKLTATPGFAFFFIPNLVTTLETLGSIRVSQRTFGYRQFPENTAEYLRVRGGRNLGDPPPDPDHSDDVAFGAAEITHTVLPLIASEYFKLSDKFLSVNDISLPMGGVFDDNQDWGQPHAEHRFGRDVDINRAGTDCKLDLHLRAAINKFLVKLSETSKGTPRPFPSALLCESGGRKHIDITWLVTGPVI